MDEITGKTVKRIKRMANGASIKAKPILSLSAIPDFFFKDDSCFFIYFSFLLICRQIRTRF